MLYTEILKDNKIFLSLYQKGKCIVSKEIVIYFRKNKLSYNRFGITAGKKIGNAVCRNRAKRIIREAYRQNELLMPLGLDIVIVARTPATTIKSDVISNFLKNKAVKQINKFLCEQQVKKLPQKEKK